MEPTILVSNDDGWDAPGIRALTRALRSIGRVIVVAPQGQRSAVSHSITLHKPLRLWEEQPDVWVCSGSPVDCVYLGFHTVCKEHKPDIVVSGINRGANLGNDVFYSGTVAAAMEGLLVGLPAIAVSQHLDTSTEFYGAGLHPDVDYSAAAQLTTRLAVHVLARRAPPTTLFNINVPPNYDVSRGLRVAKLGRRLYDQGAMESRDPRGRAYYWVGGSESGFDPIEGSDCVLLHEGFATVTPVKADMTDTALLQQLEDWHLESPLPDSE